MKHKGLLITTIIFFLIINTTYYWAGKLGLFAFLLFLLLIVAFFGLVIILFWQIYLAIKEKFIDKHRLVQIGLLTIVLVLTFIKPFGLFDFEKLEGNNLLVAEREGAANCMTILKFKDDYTFKERSVCFGVTEIKGKFHLQNDTIYFDNIKQIRNKSSYYEFAVIKPSKFKNDEELVMHENLKDTVGSVFWITKNELNKLKSKKLNR